MFWNTFPLVVKKWLIKWNWQEHFWKAWNKQHKICCMYAMYSITIINDLIHCSLTHLTWWHYDMVTWWHNDMRILWLLTVWYILKCSIPKNAFQCIINVHQYTTHTQSPEKYYCEVCTLMLIHFNFILKQCWELWWTE